LNSGQNSLLIKYLCSFTLQSSDVENGVPLGVPNLMTLMDHSLTRERHLQQYQ